MSNFLTNLVSRSLGTVKVVQPRVPSLYEPYRSGGGLLGALPAPVVSHFESPVEAFPDQSASVSPFHHGTPTRQVRETKQRGLTNPSDQDIADPHLSERTGPPAIPARPILSHS